MQPIMHYTYNFDINKPFTIYHPEEIWFDLNCFNIRTGYYEISNHSNIRRKHDRKVISKFLNQRGYYAVNLMTNDNLRKGFKVARLVAATFCIQYHESEIFVNHIDLDKTNDHFTNLEWVTPKGNTQHAIINGAHPAASLGEQNSRSIYTNDLIHTICRLMEDGYTNIEIMTGLNDYSESMNNLLKNIRRKNSWNFISDNYNIQLINNPPIDEMLVRRICELLEKKMIYNDIMDTLGLERNKRNSEIIGRIKRRVCFTNISKDYIW